MEERMEGKFGRGNAEAREKGLAQPGRERAIKWKAEIEKVRVG